MGQHGMETYWVSTNKKAQIVKSSMVTITLVTVTTFWGDKGVLVIVYMHKGKAINAAAYSTIDHL
jgi:Transposase.